MQRTLRFIYLRLNFVEMNIVVQFVIYIYIYIYIYMCPKLVYSLDHFYIFRDHFISKPRPVVRPSYPARPLFPFPKNRTARVHTHAFCRLHITIRYSRAIPTILDELYNSFNWNNDIFQQAMTPVRFTDGQ